MILDKEEHRQFILRAIASAQVAGPLSEVEKAVSLAREVRDAVTSAPVASPMAGDDLHA